MSPYFSCITSKVVIRMLSNNFSRNDSKLFFFCSKKNEFDASWKHGIKKKKMKINFDIFHVSTRLFFFLSLSISIYQRHVAFYVERKNERDELISVCPPFPPILAFIFFNFNLMASSTTRRKNKRRRKISKNGNWRYDYKVNGFRRTRERWKRCVKINFHLVHNLSLAIDKVSIEISIKKEYIYR